MAMNRYIECRAVQLTRCHAGKAYFTIDRISCHRILCEKIRMLCKN